MSTLNRTQLIATLGQAPEHNANVCAAWEGGSAAFTYLDDLSDVDAVVVVEDDAVAAVFDAIEAALAALSP
jgi:predicted nucleotidyltransferase